MPPEIDQLWAFLAWGYLVTIAVETPILLFGLSRRHSVKRRLAAGLWLTACTYPVVILVMVPLVWAPLGYVTYVVTAEVFAPVTECLLFYAAFGSRAEGTGTVRDMAAIVAANVASFGSGVVIDFFF